MSFKARVFDEPILEFGDGGHHIDPRQGLREFGPLQPRSGDVVNVGVIQRSTDAPPEQRNTMQGKPRVQTAAA